MTKNTTENVASNVSEQEYIVDSPTGLRLREAPCGETIIVLANKSGVLGAPFENPPEWLYVRTGELYGWVKPEFLRAAKGR